MLTCSLTDIHRNDAVVYVSGKKRMLGRIVACEGDSVEIDENGFFRVNGMPPYENVFYDTKPYADGIAYPFIVPEGEYFIMNDMRENTSDSRMTGSVSGKEIIGSVVFLIRHRGF